MLLKYTGSAPFPVNAVTRMLVYCYLAWDWIVQVEEAGFPFSFPVHFSVPCRLSQTSVVRTAEPKVPSDLKHWLSRWDGPGRAAAYGTKWVLQALQESLPRGNCFQRQTITGEMEKVEICARRTHRKICSEHTLVWINNSLPLSVKLDFMARPWQAVTESTIKVAGVAVFHGAARWTVAEKNWLVTWILINWPAENYDDVFEIMIYRRKASPTEYLADLFKNCDYTRQAAVFIVWGGELLMSL